MNPWQANWLFEAAQQDRLAAAAERRAAKAARRAEKRRPTPSGR